MVSSFLMPPWKETAEWREFNHILARTLSIHASELSQVRVLARDLQERLLTATDFMESLCLNTCTHCPTVCCLSAKVWADFKDALFWHLTGQAVPVRQPLSRMGQTCRYLGGRGCTLPRLSRPFICTWYVCPTQMSRLKAVPEGTVHIDLHGALQTIKSLRNTMEEAFISAIV